MSRRPHPAWLVVPLVLFTGLAVAFLLWQTQMTRRFSVARIARTESQVAPRTGSSSKTNDSDNASLWYVPPVRMIATVQATREAQYVGKDSCRDCHTEEWNSYLKTHHSRALEPVNLDQEPPDAKFYHEPSRRQFISRRQDGKLIHSEILSDSEGKALIEQTFEVRWAVGSGHHSRSYFVERGGFLFESPITWYASRQGWWVSPGYDQAMHDSFERPVDAGCVHCHAGRVETQDGNRYRFRMTETVIGCESCHGPGSKHVEAHQNGSTDVAQTIINPAHLDRRLQEAICAKCHLRGAASVLVRDRNIEDFRPGMHLADFRVNYGAKGQTEMSVVGHVEQMRQSRCWQQSSLTCTTCHNPHKPLLEEERTAYYRRVCTECHEPQACRLPENIRRDASPDDSCIQCHMPQTPTDIPHFAFTHHRIGIHTAASDRHAAASAGTIAPELVPLDDVSHLPSREQRRLLGLAYLEAADKATTAPAQSVYQNRALDLLESLAEDGLDDPDVWAALARIYWQRADWERAVATAQRVRGRDTPSGALINALLVLGDLLDATGHYQDAEQIALLLTQRRQFSADYLLLATSQARQNKWDEALQAMEHAVSLHPFRRNTRALYAAMLAAAGRAFDAQIERELLSKLP